MEKKNEDSDVDSLVDKLSKEIPGSSQEEERQSFRFTRKEDGVFHSIPKIPDEVSKHNNNAYSPYAFSIGPYHRSNPLTKATHRIKIRYMLALIPGQGKNLQIFLKAVVEAVRGQINELRKYYNKMMNSFSDTELTEVLVVDGCFILELFFQNADRSTFSDCPLFNMPRVRQQLNHDLILLENQIPWKTLEILWDCMDNIQRTCMDNIQRTCMDNIQRTDEVNLIALALDFFRPVLVGKVKDEFWDIKSQYVVNNYGMGFTPNHILDLLRAFLISSEVRFCNINMMSCDDLEPAMLSATTLDESGIKIQTELVDNDRRSILDVRFKDGHLVIPQLKVHGVTDALFRNIVALEVYAPNYHSAVFTAYVKLLNDLVQTTADMNLLCRKKVIHNMLRSDKATQIFSQSSEHNMHVKDDYYFSLIQEIDEYCLRKNSYCLRRWRVYVRDLKIVYFSHPWAVMSTFAACFILIMTFLQTYFTFMAYKMQT